METSAIWVIFVNILVTNSGFIVADMCPMDARYLRISDRVGRLRMVQPEKF